MTLYGNANPMYPRVLSATIMADLGVYPVVAVMGARQVGKSNLCGAIADNLGFSYHTLDERDTRERAKRDPEGLLDDMGDDGAFIDEVQRAPDLLVAIKAVVDRDQHPGQYLLSGSNQPTVRRSVAESLQGRAAYRTLRPLTLSELRFDEQHAGWSFFFGENERDVIAELERRASDHSPLDWQDAVATGGFPRAIAAPDDHRARVLDDYIETFANRDIREVIGIESAERFESFLRLTAARTGQILNVSGISTDLGTPVSTLRRWIDALQRSYLIELIPPYSRNANSRIIKAPKLVMVDSALALAGAREPEPTGFHLETLVASDMAVWTGLASGRAIYHWRLAGGAEVDFVLEERGQLLPVEVKSADRIDKRDGRHVHKFRESHVNTRRGVVLSSDPDTRVLSDGIIAAPWWAVL